MTDETKAVKLAAKYDKILRWVRENLKPGMHVKFSGSRSNTRTQYRVVDKINIYNVPIKISEYPNWSVTLATTVESLTKIVSHNQIEYKNRDGSIARVIETSVYAENDATKLSQVRIDGKWVRMIDLIKET